MNVRRIELTPVLLLLFAGVVLDLSWMATQFGATSAPGKQQLASSGLATERGGLEWPLNQLPPLDPVLLDLAVEDEFDTFSYESSFGPILRLTPPQLSTPPSFDPSFGSSLGSSALDLMVVAPLAPRTPPVVPKSRLVLLLPSKPHHSAASAVLQEQRKKWSLFGFDTIGTMVATGRWMGGGQWKEPASKESFLAQGGPLLMAPMQHRLAGWRQKTHHLKVHSLSIAQYLADGMEGGLFPTPHQLGEQLGRLSQQPVAGGWAWTVAYRVRGIVGSQPSDEVAIGRSLSALSQASEEAKDLAEKVDNPKLATELRRAHYALDRRTAAWSAVLLADLDKVESATEGMKRLQGARWAMSGNGWALGAGKMLYVPHSPATELAEVAAKLEQYEAVPSGDQAQEIVKQTVRLAKRGDAAGKQMANAVEQHYRNANIRVAIAAEMIERLLPQAEPTVSAVRDRIAGAQVRGKSTTRTQVSIRTIPDENSWRIGIDTRGKVFSDTFSHGGPAVLRSQGTTQFNAKKLIILTNNELRSAPSVARASIGRTRLVGLSTSYDSVPLLGSYVRSEARDKYTKARRRAGLEVQKKVEHKVRKALDTRVDSSLVRVEQRFRQEILRRAKRLGLEIDPIEMRTTDKRIIGRVRLASKTQLSAHTPRMRAPSDSLFSMQMHESAINNVIEGLELAGKRMTAAELRNQIAEKLDFTPKAEADPEADRAIIRFSANDPIRIIFADGQAEMVLAIDEMIVRGVRHRNFKVHTFYRPEVNGLVAEMVQEGTPQIEGRMRTASRLRLHGVLGKVLGEQRRIPLVCVPVGASPAVAEGMKGLVTTQCVLEDGWLGIAVAPERPVDRVALQVGSYVR